jgi:hypothetical protein
MKFLSAFSLVVSILLLSSCSVKEPGVEVDTEIWPYELYNKFNLRTVHSRYSNGLRYYCASYPKDYYRPDQLYMPNTDKIIMENNETLLSFEFITNSQIVLEEVQKDGTYKAKTLHTIYYNEDFDDYRASTRYIKKHEKCVPYVIAEDLNTSENETPKK